MNQRDLVFVADSHLEGGDDAEIARFVRFLEARRRDTAVLYLVGDIFKIWLGSDKFTMNHQRRVVTMLESLRQAGVRLVMVEGNREFFLGRFEGTAFDRVESQVATEVFAGLRFHVSHGDLLNTRDWPYRVFRLVTKSRPVWWMFNLLPGGAGVRIANRLESRLKSVNLRHKRHFPTDFPNPLTKRTFEGADGQDFYSLGIQSLHEMKHVNFRASDLGTFIEEPYFDFNDLTPVDDETFSAFTRFYEYDPVDLDTRETTVETTDGWIRELVEITAAYPEERVPLHVFLPRNTQPPYQTVIYFPGGTAFYLSSSEHLAEMSALMFLPRAGRALVFPVLKDTYERRLSRDTPLTPTRRRQTTVCGNARHHACGRLCLRATGDSRTVVTLPVRLPDPIPRVLYLYRPGL